MARTSDSDQDDQLILTAFVDCDECGAAFTGTWRPPEMDMEQIVEPPEEDQTCPACGHVHQSEEYPGFINYGDAG